MLFKKISCILRGWPHQVSTTAAPGPQANAQVHPLTSGPFPTVPLLPPALASQLLPGVTALVAWLCHGGSLISGEGKGLAGIKLNSRTGGQGEPTRLPGPMHIATPSPENY